MPLAPNTRVGPYEIIAPIGAGGMGEVYRALDTRLGRTVALKVLPESVAADEERLRRFEVEARAVADLSHPNILTIFDFGRDGTVTYAALELVEGVTLKSALAAGPLPARKAADYGRQIARGLAAAHASGVLHRDVKPANVMVTADGQIKLLDFGLARRVETPKAETTFIAALTDPGKVLGTIGYMAPEQVRGGELDERSDIFAVGVVLYEMLAGEPPFGRADRADALAAVLRDDPAPLPSTVPTTLQRIVQRCLEKLPDERYQSAADLAFSLEAFSGVSGTTALIAAADSPPPARKRRAIPLAAAIALAAVALAAGWLAERWWSPPDATGIPTFSRVTFRRGTVFRGRFAPGEQSVIYDAAWEGGPLDVFETAIGSRDARARGLAPAALFDVSPSGDIAIAQAPRLQLRHLRTGRLALATASGSPRPLGSEVAAADWTPDGGELVVARREGTEWRIEWPLGEVFYRTPNVVSDLRVSPSGDRVAWLERASFGRGSQVTVADRSGKARVVAQAGTTPGGIAWGPTGAEVWFTGAKSPTLADLELRAVTLDGRSRVVLDVPGGLRLLDIAPDGRVLVSRVGESSELFVEEGGTQRALGWRSSSTLRDLSNDGRQVLFAEDGPSGFDLFMRPTSGGPAVRLANGIAWDQARLSPDASRVALRDGEQVRLIPVGPGNVVNVATPGQVFAWSPDSRRVLLWGAGDRGGRPALRPIDATGAEEIIEGLECSDPPVLSITGTDVACRGRDGAIAVRSLGAGTTRRVTPASELGRLITWSSDGRELFAFISGAPPQAIRSLDLASGRVSVLRELNVLDPTGVWRVGPVAMTADRRTVAYSLSRQLDELYVYTGLR